MAACMAGHCCLPAGTRRDPLGPLARSLLLSLSQHFNQLLLPAPYLPPTHPPSLSCVCVCVCVCSERHQRGRPRGHELRRVGGIKCERCTVQCRAVLRRNWRVHA